MGQPMKKEKCKANLNIYLILEKDGKVLFSLRQGTGFEDGNYNLVAGHVDMGESPTKAAIREAREEVGITIREHDLQMVHAMYRKSDRENLDLFFLCDEWAGEVKNKEPQKCGELTYFAPGKLPANTSGYIKKALEHIRNGEPYSEFS
jgi:8-oxo-dGTP diphosphatase